jgi:hypothetical protein
LLTISPPNLKKCNNLVKRYSELENEKLVFNMATFKNYPVADEFVLEVNCFLEWYKKRYSNKYQTSF